MQINDYLSDDGHAVLALCSNLALPDSGDLEALKLSEWNQLEEQIRKSALAQPAALRGRAAADLARELGLPQEEADRITRLLDRAGRLASELEALFSKGMWAITRVDDQYPSRLRETLKHQAPSVLFGAGSSAILRERGVAIIGSRHIDEPAAAFARTVGREAAASGLVVVSGGARGTDRLGMEGGLDGGGQVVGVLADSLERTIRQPDLSQLLADGQLVFVTLYAPTAGFSVGAAMGRNKAIYGLAQYAVVVSSDFQSGGTWAGAVEALKGGWCPVCVRDGGEVPKGNRELVKLGGIPLPQDWQTEGVPLADWLAQNARVAPKAREQTLLGL